VGGGCRNTIVAKNEPHPDQVTGYLRTDPLDANLVTSVVYPDGKSVLSAYNPDGTLLTKTDQRGWTTTFTRDGLGRVTQEDVSTLQGRPVEGTVRVIYRYDGLGRTILQTSRDNRGLMSLVQSIYTWNTVDEDEKTKKSSTIKERQYLSFSSYGLLTGVESVIDERNGTRSALTYPDGWQLSYIRDKIRRVTNIKDGLLLEDPSLSVYTYLGDYVAERTLGYEEPITWGAADLSQYDAYGRPILCKYTGAADLVRLKYAYDNASNLTWRFDDLMQGLGSPVHWSQKYDYDNLHRLIKTQQGELSNWESTPFAPTIDADKTWTWHDFQTGDPKLDKLGNWVNFDNAGTTDARTHNSANEITARTLGGNGRLITPDVAGNLWTLQDETGTTGWRYTYDYRNRLVKVQYTTDITAGNPSWTTKATYPNFRSLLFDRTFVRLFSPVPIREARVGPHAATPVVLENAM